MSILYVSYDGATEPIGQSQVVAYLTKLRALGHDIALMSFEKRDVPASESRRCREQLQDAGIDWLPRRYHKRPSVPATAFDIANGIGTGLWRSQRRGVGIVHARSYVPAAICLALKRMTGARFLFDIRNFWADEKVDAGHWRAGGRLWRTTKGMERRFFLGADHVVTLTGRSRDALFKFDYLRDRPPAVSVIPTCVDLDLFRRHPGAPPAGRTPTVVYSGSFGGRYDDVLVGRFFAALKHLAHAATLQIWSRHEPARTVAAAMADGVPREAISWRTGSRTEVAAALATAHIGISFLRDGTANVSSMPTKIAEYLACGLLVATSPGVGDFDPLLQEYRCGVRLPRENPDPAEIEAAARDALALLEDPALPIRARRLAETEFSLVSGVARYDAIYRTLGS